VTLRNFLMLVSDYYKVLGLDRSANGDAIKRAYRKIALKV
jgi:DnaJ-class molecular chaperone